MLLVHHRALECLSHIATHKKKTFISDSETFKHSNNPYLPLF